MIMYIKHYWNIKISILYQRDNLLVAVRIDITLHSFYYHGYTRTQEHTHSASYKDFGDSWKELLSVETNNSCYEYTIKFKDRFVSVVHRRNNGTKYILHLRKFNW